MAEIEMARPGNTVSTVYTIVIAIIIAFLPVCVSFGRFAVIVMLMMITNKTFVYGSQKKYCNSVTVRDTPSLGPQQNN
jgi:hypothetical protein